MDNVNECMTVVFRKNVESFKSNPMHIKSVFGDVVAISRGDALEQARAAAVKPVQNATTNPASLSSQESATTFAPDDAQIAPRTDVAVPSGRTGEGVASTGNTERKD